MGRVCRISPGRETASYGDKRDSGEQNSDNFREELSAKEVRGFTERSVYGTTVKHGQRFLFPSDNLDLDCL